MNTARRIWQSALVSLTLALPLVSRAAPCDANDPNSPVCLDNPLGAGTTPTLLLDKIFTNGLDLLAVLMPILVIIGAFQMMFSSGDPEEFAKGRKTIVYAAIGFALVISAKGITAIIKSILTV